MKHSASTELFASIEQEYDAGNSFVDLYDDMKMFRVMICTLLLCSRGNRHSIYFKNIAGIIDWKNQLLSFFYVNRELLFNSTNIFVGTIR